MARDYKEVEARNREIWAFQSQKANAKTRGIEWKLTFDEWLNMWFDSGKWKERGQGSNQYCMARKGDTGPYSLDNVEIMTNKKNISERISWNAKISYKDLV